MADSAPDGMSNRHHPWVFASQVRTTLKNMTVIRGGQHHVVLKDAGGLANLDRARFQDFNFVDDDFFGKTHFRNCRLAETDLDGS